AFPLREHTELAEGEIRERIVHVLSLVGLGEDILRLLPSELSGGMRKRVGIARALVIEPELMLFDEPTAGLDPTNSKMVGELILELKRGPCDTSIVVTHDVELARTVADRLAILMDGRFAAVVRAGVQIGRVKRVNLPAEPGGKVRVDLTIAKRFGNRVRKNSVARIETQGLLGDRIVELTVGTAEAPPTKDGDVVLARDPTDFSKIVSEGAQTVKNVAALAESLKGTADSLRQSRLVEDASATLASARKVTDQVSRMVGEVEKGRGWAHALIYEEPVALRKMNDVIASTQRLLDRVERGEGAAGVLTSEASTAAARRFVAAMDKLARTSEQPGSADEGLLPALLFDPRYN